MGEAYNAAVDLLERNRLHREKPAFRQDGRVVTYEALCERANRAGNALVGLGMQMEQRVLLCMLDTPDFAATARLYGEGVLGIRPDDVVYSAAKLFFAYGLGNAMTFPFAVGACTVLLADRPTPQSVVKLLREERPTLFFGVPTLFAAILADPAASDLGGRLRFCVSAGEPLPRDIGVRWRARAGVGILDGVGPPRQPAFFL